jgi:3-oxoacyl-[acyl-carrier protein] reductase
VKKLIVVTGASRGLGLSIVRKLAEQDFRVVAISRGKSDDLTSLTQTADVHHVLFDLAETSQIQSLTREIIGKHGRCFGLVNNAALGVDGVLGTLHDKDIEKCIRVNLQSPILLSKYLSRSMLICGEGRIVNISSIVASTGYSGLSVYGATKAGIIGFTKSLSRELGKAGILVNNVSPGYMETEMTQGISGDKLEAIKRRSPLGQLVSVDSVAEVVAFLLSNKANQITGATYIVDAGSTA